MIARSKQSSGSRPRWEVLKRWPTSHPRPAQVYVRLLHVYAKADAWTEEVAKCATVLEAEKQMLVYVRIERLDAVKQSVYHGLYEDEHVDAAEAAKYASFFKVCCGWAVVAVICLGLVYLEMDSKRVLGSWPAQLRRRIAG